MFPALQRTPLTGSNARAQLTAATDSRQFSGRPKRARIGAPAAEDKTGQPGRDDGSYMGVHG
jgi:hypothetical protein